jgi:hypothetical protein
MSDLSSATLGEKGVEVTSRPSGSSKEVGSVSFPTVGVIGDHDDRRRLWRYELAGILEILGMLELEVREFQSYGRGTTHDSLPPHRYSVNFEGHD